MIRFLLKGIFRDPSRSLFPVIVVMTGVALTVLIQAWMAGMKENLIESSANFDTGHVKITSRSYAEEGRPGANELALLGLDSLLREARSNYPGLHWTPRIRFGGLLDIPDDNGETMAQGPVIGLGVDLLSENSQEAQFLNLQQALTSGSLPSRPGDILISDLFAQKLNINIGQSATLLGVTMYGSPSMSNFRIVGTVRFGIAALDRGAMLADISDIQPALDMDDAVGEILGFFTNHQYDQAVAAQMTTEFNRQAAADEFAPLMQALHQQNGLGEMLNIAGIAIGIIILIFVLVMFLVLWNAGLMATLRRYGEIGLRLAIGESKRQLYFSMLSESVMVGIVGSILGTITGLTISYYLQVEGLDIGSMIKNASMMISGVLRAKVTMASVFIGFIPGVSATVLGTAVSGLGIFRRQTSQLFKELETS